MELEAGYLGSVDSVYVCVCVYVGLVSVEGLVMLLVWLDS